MATDLPELRKVNATGVGAQDLRSEDGGNQSRGVLDQLRPTAIIATGASRKMSKDRTSGKRK